MKKAFWGLTIFFAILVGLLPFSYLSGEERPGFLAMKSEALLRSFTWLAFFYVHIFSGGIAILTGWTQFSSNRLKKYPAWHRNIGRIYVISALICAASGVYVGFYANGGPVARAGFVAIGMVYFYTTFMGYHHIRSKAVIRHQQMMIFSYAACLGAVTLRLYMPFLVPVMGSYDAAYRVTAWLSWVPNLLIAAYLCRKTVSEARINIHSTDVL